MNTELTEEDMRRALFGGAEASAATHVLQVADDIPDVVIVPTPSALKQMKAAKHLTPKIKVTLRVGNEFEGEMEGFIYEADTLSTVLAEQEASRAARKKYKYVEVVSVIRT